jgi:hypothetical protein
MPELLLQFQSSISKDVKPISMNDDAALHVCISALLASHGNAEDIRS